jgi:hypothetical protein
LRTPLSNTHALNALKGPTDEVAIAKINVINGRTIEVIMLAFNGDDALMMRWAAPWRLVE